MFYRLKCISKVLVMYFGGVEARRNIAFTFSEVKGQGERYDVKV